MTARETIQLYATLADMKEVDHKTTLAVTTLIELLIEKGLFTKEEFAVKARVLDASSQ